METTPMDRHSLPVTRPPDTEVSARPRSFSAGPGRTVPPPADSPPAPASPRRHGSTQRVALVCLVLAAGAAAVFIPIVRAAGETQKDSSGSFGQAIGGILLQGGLPPTGDVSPAESESYTASETERDTVSFPESDTLATVLPAESESTPPSDGPEATDTYPASDTTAPTIADTDPVTEPDLTETEPDPEAPPADAYPVAWEDRSEPGRPAGYIMNTAGPLPGSIPGDGTRLWSTASAPTVLLVHTHPYEGYGDGRAWYDPASGPLAETSSTSDPNGVVALGACLATLLRESGVTVIHLRVPVAEGESAASTYARTAAMVQEYCRLYPDIGLVLDLGRSAELTEAGAILATAGELDGEPCAQVRLSVSGGREEMAVARDIALAVALRRSLAVVSPSISRPVWVKGGTGLDPADSDVLQLSVDLGSAGNTFAEAERLLVPLSDAIAELVLAK